MGPTVTVPSAETKPQGNTTAPPAVTVAKVSFGAPYARATSTLAGTPIMTGIVHKLKIYSLFMQLHTKELRRNFKIILAST